MAVAMAPPGRALKISGDDGHHDKPARCPAELMKRMKALRAKNDASLKVFNITHSSSLGGHGSRFPRENIKKASWMWAIAKSTESTLSFTVVSSHFQTGCSVLKDTVLILGALPLPVDLCCNDWWFEPGLNHRSRQGFAGGGVGCYVAPGKIKLDASADGSSGTPRKPKKTKKNR